jgi:hypothetical protein
MPDFNAPHTLRKARKAHRCIYCAEAIDTGTEYAHQTGNYDGRWYANKMHPECFDDLYSDGEFTPYSNDRPKALDA